MMMEAPGDPVRRVGECGGDIAFADGELANEIGAEQVMHEARARRERGFWIEHGRQWLEIEDGKRGRVLRRIPAFRDDDGERLAKMPDLVGDQQGLPRTENLVRNLRAPFAGHQILPVRCRWQCAREFGACDRVDDPRRGPSLRQIDRFDASVGDRTAHQRRMQHSGQYNVGDVLALTGQETTILLAQHPLADKCRALFVHADPGLRVGPGP